MRALCGAIITAGALIGLGLSAVGFGLRHGAYVTATALTTTNVETSKTDPLAFIIVFLTIVACVGLGIAFLGLAYHHHRRHHELLRMQGVPGVGHSVMP